MTEAIVKNIPNRNLSWNDDGERLLLFADFMGFKSRVYTKDHATLKKELEQFHCKFMKRLSPLMMGDHLKSSQFSDSILIVVNGINNKMFNLISKAAVSLVQISMENGIPIKGAIAQGIFTFDEKKQLFFGKPLIDAYLLEEESKYYGITVHHSAEKTIRSYNSSLNPYSNTEVPLEKGMVSHYHLCWNLISQQLQPKDNTEQCLKWLDDISLTVSGQPRIYVDKTKKVLRQDRDIFQKDRELNNEETSK